MSPSVRQRFSILKLFFAKISRDNLLLYAQGLTFNTLLTLIPLIGLVLSIGRTFLDENLLLQRISSFLSNYLYTEALIKTEEKIISILKGLKDLPLGKFSLVLYFLMSLGIFSQIEDALNRIFLAPKNRSIRDRILLYWIAITLAPFVLLIPLFLHTFIQLHHNFQLITYFIFVYLFFYLLYSYFPTRKIARIPALVGAFLITLFWYFVSFAFGVYVKKAIIYSKLYGSLSVIPLFLIFLFTNWTVFLLGAELTYFIEKKPWRKFTSKVQSPLRELLILLYLTKAFYDAVVTTINSLEKELPLSSEDIIKGLKNLEKWNLVYLKDEEVFLRLPPEKITLQHLVSSENLNTFENRFPELKKLLEKLYTEGTLVNLSLKDLITLDT